MGDVTSGVGKNEIVNVRVWDRRESILYKAVEQQSDSEEHSRSENNWGCKKGI